MRLHSPHQTTEQQRQMQLDSSRRHHVGQFLLEAGNRRRGSGRHVRSKLRRGDEKIVKQLGLALGSNDQPTHHLLQTLAGRGATRSGALHIGGKSLPVTLEEVERELILAGKVTVNCAFGNFARAGNGARGGAGYTVTHKQAQGFKADFFAGAHANLHTQICLWLQYV